jgi:hypothetical protein
LTKRRVIASAAVLVPATLLMLATFGWLAIVATDGPVRIAATVGVGFVIAVSVGSCARRIAITESHRLEPADYQLTPVATRMFCFRLSRA